MIANVLLLNVKHWENRLKKIILRSLKNSVWPIGDKLLTETILGYQHVRYLLCCGVEPRILQKSINGILSLTVDLKALLGDG
jgi:hypothetical protein